MAKKFDDKKERNDREEYPKRTVIFEEFVEYCTKRLFFWRTTIKSHFIQKSLTLKICKKQ